jgi:hypothetical protein
MLRERVGLVGAGREHAARSPEGDAAPHHVDAVGQERGRERVAGVAGVLDPVEGESQRPGTVDPAESIGTIDVAHGRDR